jgi:hypothetical protein
MKSIRPLFLLGFALLAPALLADAEYRPATGTAGILYLPALNIAGTPSLSDVQLELDLSSQRIVSVSYSGGANPTARADGDYQIQTSSQGILTVPVLRLNGAPVYKQLKLGLDFSSRSFQILAAQPARPVMLGAYTGKFTGDPAVVESEFKQLDQWAGKRLSLAGMFVDLETDNPGYAIPTSLELLRQNGYTAFVNLASWRSAADIADGKIDPALRGLAQAFATWLNGGADRWVWISPLPEMNGTWETYTADPATFKRAFLRIQQIFRDNGVGKGARWAFSPNGWSWPERNFELFYPGDANIDAVGFSGYNRGFCTSFDFPRWETPEQVFGTYLQRMRAMAPSKPIIISQTASSSDTANGKSEAAKDAWLRDSYAYLARSDSVAGIMYFNIDKECDWAFHRPGGVNSAGYRDAAADALFGYVPMEQMGGW